MRSVFVNRSFPGIRLRVIVDKDLANWSNSHNEFSYGEFDPGSERTLAAWIRHASRTRKVPSGTEYSGKRVSNAWGTCLSVWDNTSNEVLIPNIIGSSHGGPMKGGL